MTDVRVRLLMLSVLILPLAACGPPPPEGLSGDWRAQLDLAGGPLHFHIELTEGETLSGQLCNATKCDPFSGVARLPGDSLLLEMGDYAAAIRVNVRGDSLVGFYRNVGNRGPRTIPFTASRGTWPGAAPSESLVGQWDATFEPDTRPSPRVLDFRRTERGPGGHHRLEHGRLRALLGGRGG